MTNIPTTRSLLSLSLLLWSLIGWTQTSPIIIKVLSYNIHYGVGIDGQTDLNRIAEVINNIDPDIVGLQEVSDSVMVADLSKLTKMSGVFGASTEIEPPNLYRLLDIPVPAAQLHYGDGILSKYPFRYVGNLSIPSASSSRYEAMCIEVDIPGQQVGFITTHFDYLETIGSRMARKASVDVIEEAFFSKPTDVPFILSGDLNVTPNSGVIKMLESKGWVTERFEKDLYTVPSQNPKKQIDYVLVRPQNNWRILGVEVIDASIASDHLPILMTLELRQ